MLSDTHQKTSKPSPFISHTQQMETAAVFMHTEYNVIQWAFDGKT